VGLKGSGLGADVVVDDDDDDDDDARGDAPFAAAALRAFVALNAWPLLP